jgi:hypothetical protein
LNPRARNAQEKRKGNVTARSECKGSPEQAKRTTGHGESGPGGAPAFEIETKFDAQVREHLHQFRFGKFTKEKEMVNSRKLLLLLVAIAVVATSGLAQTVVTCVGRPVNAPLRGGGVTELVGDLVLACTPSPKNADETAFINASVNVSVAGGLGGAVTSNGGKIFLEVSRDYANEPSSTPGFFVQDVVGTVGAAQSGQTTISFNGVTLPTGTQSLIRITNIRVPAPLAAGASGLQTVTEQVSITLPALNSIQFGNGGLSTFTVGTVFDSLAFSLTSCADLTKNVTSIAYDQCIAQPKTNSASFLVKFSESAATPAAFKATAADGLAGNVAVEDGNTSNFLTGAGAIKDVATTGTRLIVNFTNIPTGVTPYVTVRETANSGAAIARFVSDAAADGHGGEIDTDGLNPIVCSALGTDKKAKAIIVPAIDGGAGTAGENWYAVYEVGQNDQNTPETLYFGVQLFFDASSSGLPAPTTASGTVTGNYAPVNLAADSVAIPRFRTLSQSAGVSLTINACTTNLLFPYVTSDTWDTGLAFSNTSKDDNGTHSTTGACTLNFFGTNAPASAATFPATGSIDPGATQTALLSSLAPNFTGYIVARCAFQYGHALALLIEPGSGAVSFGSSTAYLALVIPSQEDRPAQAFTVSGTGEMLGF